MAVNGIHGCSICGKPTYFSYRFYSATQGGPADQGYYEIGCSECGEYRVAASAELAMMRQSPLYRATIIRMIHAANVRGNRYCLDDGREVPLKSVATPTDVEVVPNRIGRPSATASGSTPADQVERAVAPRSSSPAEAPPRRPEQR